MASARLARLALTAAALLATAFIGGASTAAASGPINAIEFDLLHKTMWGGSSNHGEDYGIAW